ncbi:MAG: hypothetical protein LC632_06165 [Xanthomonadaceae bacterium]|nr:hypothetical protein [Xanthomonadaceae bacterium]
MERRYPLFRTALGLFALTAATLAALPSEGFTWSIWWGDWAILPTLVIGNLTAAMAIVITLAMVLRADAFRRAWSLGIGLCAAVTAWGIWTSPWLSADPVGVAILPAAWLTAAVAVANFYVVFPARPSPEALRDVFFQMRQRTLDSTHRKMVGMPDANGGVHDPGAYFDAPVNWMSRLNARIVGQERYRNWVLRSVERERDRIARDRASERHRRVLARVGDVMIRPWPILGVLIAVILLLAGFTSGDPVIVVVMLPTLYIALAMITARERYLALEGPEDRTRGLWLLQALVIGYICASLFVPVLFISVVLDTPLRLGMAPIILGCGALAFISCLAVAVFRFGALDPALVMRRSIVLGAIIFLLTLVFAAVETFVSELLTEWLGLPENSGAYAASATAAAVFGPLWKRLSGWADRVVDRILPSSVS